MKEQENNQQKKIDELEKKIRKLEKENKELKDESERKHRLAMYIEGRCKDLWNEKRIIIQDILNMKKQIEDYITANNELSDMNAKLSKQLNIVLGNTYTDTQSIKIGVDVSTQTENINNNQAKKLNNIRRTRSYDK